MSRLAVRVPNLIREKERCEIEKVPILDRFHRANHLCKPLATTRTRAIADSEEATRAAISRDFSFLRSSYDLPDDSEIKRSTVTKLQRSNGTLLKILREKLERRFAPSSKISNSRVERRKTRRHVVVVGDSIAANKSVVPASGRHAFPRFVSLLIRRPRRRNFRWSRRRTSPRQANTGNFHGDALGTRLRGRHVERHVR